MGCQLRIGNETWARTREYLLGRSVERMAYLLARASEWGRTTVDLLVCRSLPVPDAALVIQTPVQVEIDPGFTREVLLACYEAGLSLVDVHTHPFARRTVWFSGHDVRNMRQTHQEFVTWIPQDPPAVAASLVMGHDSVAGAWLDPRTRRLEPLSRFHLLNDGLTEVALCSS